MSKLKGQRARDEYMQRKRNALTIVAPTQVAPVAPSAVAPYSPSDVHRFDNRDPGPHHRRARSETQPATLWRRLMQGHFVSDPAPTTTVDLITLRREIKDWVKLQNEIDRLRNARPPREIARYVFLILAAAFYVFLAFAAVSGP